MNAEIVIAAIGLIFTIITAYILPLTKKTLVTYVIPFIQSKLTEAQLDLVKKWVDIAVRYFENKIKEEGVKLGENRKAAVIKFIQRKGLNVSEADLDKIIDSVVKHLNDTEWKS